MAAVNFQSDSVGVRTRRRVMSRLIPYLFLMYVIAYLDRVNVSYAALQMKVDLHFTDDVLGFGAGVFFIGYILLEIPGSLLVEKWSARGWMARIMISWGIVAMLMGAVHTKNQFYIMRFLLGVAEAGFFPGMIVYLSHWFRYEDRAKAVALFMSGQPLSNILGSPLSGLLLGVNWLGLAGWRWLFIIEGAPAVIFGFITIFYLTDRPHQAQWLSKAERDWLTSELKREQQAKDAFRSYGILEALRQRGVIFLALAYFCIVTAVYGFTFWLPTIIKKQSGLSNLQVSLISAIPYCVGLATILIVGWSSDKTKERRWHTALSMIVASTGLLLAVVMQNNLWLAVTMFCVTAIGIYGYLPGFWALPTSFLTGSAAAVSIGLINLIGNLGGFAGPYVVGYLSNLTNSFVGGIAYLSLSALVGAFLVLSLKKHDTVAAR
ncbi:MAG: MFS transporter [Acidobacteria bacterium]|nr:MAG: MFS transporter [Acidobacteriota bacterium]